METESAVQTAPKPKKKAVVAASDGKKAAKKKVAKKAPAKEASGKGKSDSGLSPNQVKVLQALKNGRELTRAELAEKTGIAKGYSRLLGTADGGHEDSLSAQGMVKTLVATEGERGMRYVITAKGKKAIGA